MEENAAPRITVGVVDGENVLVRPSWLNQYPLVLLVFILEAAIVYFSIAYPELATFPLRIGSITLSGSYLAIAPFFVLAKAAFNVYNERLVITPSYLILVTGRISWRERSSRLEYPHIQEIETVQSIAQRILGLGDLNILPIGAGNRQAICIKGVRNPRGVKDLVRSFKTNSEEPTDSSS